MKNNKPIHLMTIADTMTKKELKIFQKEQQEKSIKSKKLKNDLDNAIRVFNKMLFPLF